MSMRTAVRMTAPVDPEIFLEMVNVFQGAADKPLPASPCTAAGYYPTDIPLNRGMSGVLAALHSKGVDEQFEAVMFRLMSLSSVLKCPDRFSRFIRPGKDATGLSNSLLRAAALARISASSHSQGFDLADVLAHAERFEKQFAPHSTGRGQE